MRVHGWNKLICMYAMSLKIGMRSMVSRTIQPESIMTWNQFFSQKKYEAEQDNLYRSLNAYDTASGGYLTLGEHRLLNLSSNDYLGLATDAAAREDAQVLSGIIPIGAGASRLITGTFAIHEGLAQTLADWKKTEAALVYPTGYQTNLGLISALARRGDVIYADRANHASLIDGCQLSGATMVRYRHADLNDLEAQLKAHKRGKRLIVSDGVFSMDGDVAPLAGLNELAMRYDALLIVDEAHASGVMGPKGAGAWAREKLKWAPHVALMGTLSKAIGAQGGFVCGSRALIEHLINFSRPFIYTTGLSPIIAGVAQANIVRIQTEPERLRALKKAIRAMSSALTKSGVTLAENDTPILPVIVGDNGAAVRAAAALRDQNIIAAAIRTPTVPEGTARLRVSVSAVHDPAELRRAARLIAQAVKEVQSE
ncbi:MAG: 8-amino-7-oxononanoate synthase [bacterium]|nr:8-amino-7-oxononanoate synthase [bacterium]